MRLVVVAAAAAVVVGLPFVAAVAASFAVSFAPPFEAFECRLLVAVGPCSVINLSAGRSKLLFVAARPVGPEGWEGEDRVEQDTAVSREDSSG